MNTEQTSYRAGRGDHADRLERQEAFRVAQAEARRHPCDLPPYGCSAAVGEPCTVIGRPDLPLGRQPAHLGRLRKAGLVPGSTVGTGVRRDTDRPDSAPVPRQNLHLYDHDDDHPVRHPEEPML